MFAYNLNADDEVSPCEKCNIDKFALPRAFSLSDCLQGEKSGFRQILC